MRLKYFISKPSGPLFGVISVPGDKSISHRAIILAAIAEGMTTIHGFLTAKDCMATLNAFRLMGVSIEGPIDHRVIVHGVGKYGLQAPEQVIDCGNSGTTMRLLTGLLAGQSFASELSGDESLCRRPMRRISHPLQMMGADVQTHEACAPIKINAVKALSGITYELPEASAQVKSCLLLAGMYAQGETTVIEPGITRDHTERMLSTFSYPIQKAQNRIVINSESVCLGCDVNVPGDLSSAAFFIVAASLIKGSELYIRNVGVNPSRTGVIQILQLMQADISIMNKRLCGEELVADISVKYAALEGIDIPPPLVPLAIDEFPILFIAAACAKGKTILHGARELRLKESDRIQAMVNGLQSLGIDAEALDDGVIIQGGHFKGGTVDAYGDHRIAMAFAIAGALSDAAVTIQNCENVSTSFPNFIELSQSIHLDIEEQEDV